VNLTDEFTPFNYFFFKGVRTALQIAPFYEAGSVSETSGSLGQYWRTDAGIGIRLATASGAVYRVDIAEGDEGTATTIIFNYPW
jgi:outer membrane translocation and assembly module TamA